MNKKETILLDARLTSVIDNNAFGAELRNGHHIIAFFRRGDVARCTLKIGEEIKVEMSPYDMSKGRLMTNQEQ
jgi:translation initiation factor IF-1